MGITRAEAFVKRVTTNATSKPVLPDVTFTNRRNNDVRIFNLGLVPEIGFLTRGHAVLEIESMPTLLEIIPNDLLDILQWNTDYQQVGGLMLEKNTDRELVQLIKNSH